MPFLETIEKGITKAKDLGELSRLNTEIAIRENHRRECLTVMGEKYYNALNAGFTPDCSVLYQELKTIDQELELLQREVQKLKKVMICPKCGTKITSFGMFCPNCGEQLRKRNVCPGCGTVLDSDANFCVNCGNRAMALEDRRE